MRAATSQGPGGIQLNLEGCCSLRVECTDAARMWRPCSHVCPAPSLACSGDSGTVVQGATLQAITMQTWLKRIQQALSQSSEGTELAMPPKMAALWRMHTPLEHHPPLVGNCAP